MAGIQCETVVFEAANGNGAKIAGYYYPSSAGEIKGVVQICHGMAEYLARYEKFIESLNEAGFHVCGIDMLGHGKTYKLNESIGYPKGYFGKGGKAAADTLKDIMEMHRLARVRFGENIPYYLYGHSMGSFIVRAIFSTPEYACEFSKFVFSSTIGPNPAVVFGRFLAGAACLFGCAKKENRLLEAVAFGSYCKRIKDPSTPFDWISTDPEAVKAYTEDPMCGFSFTGGGYSVLFNYISFIQSSKAFENLSEAPCLFAYAAEDPVGSYGKGVEKAFSKMKHYGARAHARNYGPYRHELLNEPVCDDYIRDVIDFLKQ